MREYKKQLLLAVTLFVALGIIVYAATYYRVNAGIAKEVDEFGICKKVSNLSAGPDTFVPTKTDVEWGAFVSNTPSNISISACAAPPPPPPLPTNGTRWSCDCTGGKEVDVWTICEGVTTGWSCSGSPPSNCWTACENKGCNGVTRAPSTYCSSLCTNFGCY